MPAPRPTIYELERQLAQLAADVLTANRQLAALVNEREVSAQVATELAKRDQQHQRRWSRGDRVLLSVLGLVQTLTAVAALHGGHW